MDRYGKATEAYLQSMHELRVRVATSPKTDYERLRRAAEEARETAEQARIALDQHLAAHDC